jgi:hypothetical protein
MRRCSTGACGIAEADRSQTDRLRHESHDWNIDTGYWIDPPSGAAGVAVRFASAWSAVVRLTRPS